MVGLCKPSTIFISKSLYYGNTVMKYYDGEDNNIAYIAAGEYIHVYSRRIAPKISKLSYTYNQCTA